MKNVFLLCILSAFLGGIGALAAWNFAQRGPAASAFQQTLLEPVQGIPSGVQQAGDPISPEETINVRVYEACNRSVVNINTKIVRTDNVFNLAIPQEGSGSGWVLDAQGRIVTNFHVIEDAENIEVTLFDGSSYPAKLVGTDPATDIAVIQIEAPAASLIPLQFGDSSVLKVGQKVLAIGNPFGLERTLTVGIVSSLNRSLDSRNNRVMKNIIQLDAALNQGNSGGPLMNSSGKLIGMNTAIASKTGENTGVGFAVPVNTILRVVPELIKFGKVIRATTGIEAYLPTNRGLAIGYVIPESPADNAGLRGLIVRNVKRFGNLIQTQTVRQEPDILVDIDGQRIEATDDVMRIIDSKKPGDRVRITVLRKGKPVAVEVVLGAE
ncbi:MAG: trypsin-like peptidase domain-containing protein [Pirellulaceae bacterium]